MTDYHALQGRSMSLIIWNTEKENDVRVYLGQIMTDDEGVHFINESEKWNVTLTDEMLERLKEVPEHLKKTLLGADFATSASMGILPDGPREDFNPTGIKWDADD